MSHRAFEWALKVLPGEEEMTTSSAATLLLLANYYNEEWHRAWPSIPVLAAIEHADRRTVQIAMRDLRDRGLVVPERWELESGGRMANRYCLPRYDLHSVASPTTIVPHYSSGGPSREERFVPGGKNLAVWNDDLPL